jgi:hypothetical protein
VLADEGRARGQHPFMGGGEIINKNVEMHPVLGTRRVLADRPGGLE